MRCCDTSSSPQAPMLYLMFLAQVFTAFSVVFAFRLRPLPAKSQWN